MKYGNEFWLILFQEYISPKLFAVRGVGGLCPACPVGGGGEGGAYMHPASYHLPFLEKGLGALALAV